MMSLGVNRKHKQLKDGKKVLIVGQHFWPEAFRINDICDFLVEKGCEVEVLCGIPNYPSGKFSEGYGYFRNRRQVYKSIEIHRAFEIPRGNNTNLRIFLNYISFPIGSLFHIPRLLFKKHDRIFIYQLSPVMMSIAGIILGKIKRVETTMYVLDLWPENLYSVLAIQNPFLRRIIRYISHWHYKHVDKLIVLSERMKERLLEVTSVAPNKIVVIPQACEKIYENNIQDADLSRRFRSGFNIVYAGNISPAQSFETIIDAAKELRSSGITDLNWIIVGDGMSRRWAEQEVDKAQLSDIFYFEGHKPISDIPKYTAIANVLMGCLVKSDLLEATVPAKVISYIAAGRPIVLAMDGEVKELINNVIKCGLAGPAQDSRAFARNIKGIYSLSRKEQQHMGEQAKAYYFEHLERNLVLEQLYVFIFS